MNNSVNLVNNQLATGASKSLQAWISKLRPKSYCNHCKHSGHWTSKCQKFPSNKCFNCGKYGHMVKDCQLKKKKWKNKDQDKGDNMDETNNVDEHIIFAVDEEGYNFDNQCTYKGNDEQLIYYGCPTPQ